MKQVPPTPRCAHFLGARSGAPMSHLFFFLLSACSSDPAPKPADDTDTVAKESADSRPPSPFGSGCEAVGEPRIFSSADEVLQAHLDFRGWGMPVFTLPERLSEWSDSSCPIESPVYAGRILAGDCTSTQGATFTGSVEWTRGSAGDSRKYWTFTHFGLSWRGEDGRYWSFAANGTVVEGAVYETWVLLDSIDYTVDHDGSWPEHTGSWSRHSSLRSYFDHRYGRGWISSPAGAWCEAWTEQTPPPCPAEGDGNFVLDVGVLAEGILDGTGNCDGCVPITLDGVDLGTACFP